MVFLEHVILQSIRVCLNRMRAKILGKCGSLSRAFHSGCPGVRRMKSHASRWMPTFCQCQPRSLESAAVWFFRQSRETKWCAYCKRST
ncbi:hypothetical protein LT85_3892 [Collimonas arenae]|uniref:Uncharacterized protein n=1 Tax=Collimonas arenae TaxID=279058 RepID=A0A0A1FH94_9BURK|nr:hypothetical protein LT85_3892 [Collimonas arenae]